MGKTYRRNEIDQNYGCFEGYYERKGYNTGSLVRNRDDFEQWNYNYEKAFWDKRARDGSPVEHCAGKASGRRYYRHLTKKLIRNETRRKISLGLAGDDWDSMVWPDQHDAKKYIWSIW